MAPLALIAKCRSFARTLARAAYRLRSSPSPRPTSSHRRTCCICAASCGGMPRLSQRCPPRRQHWQWTGRRQSRPRFQQRMMPHRKTSSSLPCRGSRTTIAKCRELSCRAPRSVSPSCGCATYPRWPSTCSLPVRSSSWLRRTGCCASRRRETLATASSAPFLATWCAVLARPRSTPGAWCFASPFPLVSPAACSSSSSWWSGGLVPCAGGTSSDRPGITLPAAP
mmetsp:Transcript_5643/g.18013  ORF Transcript_5643/g.18013 Transcript_5643/m.18013 type:complete len:225 (+) Transcript_5643:769-1443(+)